jgi:dolichol-phosphate mannosyltransferase
MTATAHGPHISVVAPMLNEEGVARVFYERVAAVLQGRSWDLIAVDDGSTDDTPSILDQLSAEDDRVTVVHLSRPFGHQAALSAGLDFARGDAVVTIDADLQDPPEVIPDLLHAWENGAEVVWAVRRTRPSEPRWRATAIRGFYRFFGRVSDLDWTMNTGDFRLLDRRAADALRRMPERNRFLRGMARWIGFPQAEVLYDRDQRFAGETKYPLRKLLSLAADGILSFSYVPLRLASYLGFGFALIAFIGLPAAVIARVTGLIYVPGQASVIFSLCLLSGVQLMTVGMIGEYVGRTYDEAKRRPLYVVRHVVAGGREQPLEVPVLEERSGRVPQ